METVIEAFVSHINKGGPGIAWALVAYLLLRLHQLTDRQHAANLETVKALSVIRTLLLSKTGTRELEE